MTTAPFIESGSGAVTFALVHPERTAEITLRGCMTPEEVGDAFGFAEIGDGLWSWEATAAAQWGAAIRPTAYFVEGRLAVLRFGEPQCSYEALVEYMTTTFGEDAHASVATSSLLLRRDVTPEAHRKCSVRRDWGYVGAQYGDSGVPELTLTWRI